MTISSPSSTTSNTSTSTQTSSGPFATETLIQSEHAGKYLTVLCRHFARKVEAKWNDTRGTVYFPVGVTTMTVNEGSNLLTIQCVSDTKQQLEQQKLIISEHLDTYARREVIEVIWSND
ncbi:DUF2218 domain-containing protein [uncultured Vibrio sp.]|uniref:DUF2218 domain-containing protein n=1 Tax=uncultured Vibrio sp. TaxID=114054 RepID=UPI0025D65E9B|nr:DUF2218 domain-containing protein [uncultured Vibrio sp.]